MSQVQKMEKIFKELKQNKEIVPNWEFIRQYGWDEFDNGVYDITFVAYEDNIDVQVWRCDDINCYEGIDFMDIDPTKIHTKEDFIEALKPMLDKWSAQEKTSDK